MFTRSTGYVSPLLGLAALAFGSLAFTAPAGAEGGLTLEERVERLERHEPPPTVAPEPPPPPARSSLDDMISPVSMPTVNEDPRVDTELRPMYMYTQISEDFVTNGGNYSVVAAQARFAITDRIGIIATKDGYIFLRPDDVVPDDEGWANLGFGVKGVFYKDDDAAFIFSGGLRYEAASGNRDVLQGKGVGTLNPFLSIAKGFGDFHLQGYTGPILAIDDGDSSFYDVALHADYRLFERFYPLLEFNWRYGLKGGERLPIDQEGWDLVNLGSTEAGGESVATIAFGARYRIIDTVDVGAVAEFPVTDRHDILGWRVTTDLIWRPMGWNSIL
jgi:hypothetical protein